MSALGFSMGYDDLQSARELRFPKYLLVLDDEHLYSVSSVIENAEARKIFDPADDKDRAYRRLQTLFRSKFSSADGVVHGPRGPANAWYGARIKLLLPASVLPKNQRESLIERLEAILGEEGYDLSRRVRELEAQVASLRGSRNPFVSIKKLGAVLKGRPKLRFWGGLSLLASVFVVALWAWQSGSLFEPDREQANRVVIMQCAQTDAVFYSALQRALDSSRHLRAEILTADEITPSEPCGNMPGERLAELSGKVKAPFMTWGLAERDGDGYHFKGWLYQRDHGRRSFRVSSTDRLDLADAAAHQILALLGFENDMIQSHPLFSTNATANLLFSEGELFAKRGRYHSAVDNLDRASRYYDPDFTYGQTRLARALIVEGEFIEARNVLADVMALHDGTLNPQVMLSAFENLTHIHFLDFNFEELAPLLVAAKDLALREDPEFYPYFVKLEAKMNLAQGNMAMADSLISHYLNYTDHLADPAAPIFAMIVQSESAVKKKAYGEAFGILEQALSLAQKVGSVAEEVDVIVELAELALRTDSNYDFVLDQITEVETRMFGASHADTVELDYRKGLIFLATNRVKKGVDLLEDAYKDASDHGLFHLECHARIRLARHYLETKDYYEIEDIVSPLKGRIEKSPPGYRLHYEMVMWQYFIGANQFNNALSSLEEYLALAKLVRRPGEVARAINEMGNVHYKLGDLLKAERYWLDALKYMNENWPRTAEIPALNLIMLYEQQGRHREASDLKEKLGGKQ